MDGKNQDENGDAETNADPEGAAFLVVREGRTWRDVFRLTPGQVTTIGRAPTNRIVVRDDICSRNHCEIFQSGGEWTLRDLGSRNGTLINGTRVADDWQLVDGELIQIGSCDLGFTFDLSRPFPQFEEEDVEDTSTSGEMVFDHPGADTEPEIILRTGKSRYRTVNAPESLAGDRISQELTTLYRLALEMGSVPNATGLSEVVLDGLFSGTTADIGAILLLQDATGDEPTSEELQVVVYHGEDDVPYQRVSDYLSGVVLAEREAILARDIADDSRLAARDSLGEIQAKSVICAPLQVGGVLHGLIHLYSTNPEQPLDRDDLEFTLAVADQMAIALDNLKEKKSLADGLARVQDENQTLRRQLEIESELMGDSPSMHLLRERIARIAPTNATTLIRGESGVGKELVARALHYSSNRSDGPFICMNCAALTESLLESELFGHEKGSFTGADSRTLGKFEQAHQGTLFLDEVGEMGLSIQARFLRVLEGHPFERVGGGTAVEVDVRVVAATNRDLERAVEEELFRRDLYFRLHVVEVNVEPLRSRRSDVPLLANHFLDRFARKTERPVKRFTRAALDTLVNYDWPGNVRELQNVVERAVILCAGEVVTEDDIQLSALGTSPTRGPRELGSRGFREVSLDILEREHIMATLDRTNWNKSKASQILGIERSTLDRKLKRYQVKRPNR
jgi:Nif-specific regulatory protein